MAEIADVWVVGGQKGGPGKSTVAQNLAVAAAMSGVDVVLLDTDVPQLTSSNWQSVREEEGIEPKVACVVKSGKGVGSTIDDLRRRYGFVIVDSGAAVSDELLAAVTRASVLIAPFQPSQADSWTAEALDNAIERAKVVNPHLRGAVVLNRCDPNPQVAETQAAVLHFGGNGVDPTDYPHLKLMKTRLIDRVVYKRALATGRGVVDYTPADPKAIDEAANLYSEIVDYVQTSHSV